MTTRISSICSIVVVSLFAVGSFAQDATAPPSADTTDLGGLPPARGVYYRAAGEWVSLPFTIIMPFSEGNSPAMEVLNVGAHHTIAELRGSHAGIQIGNDSRPTFYLHGVSSSDLFLLRAVPNGEYRELQMPISRHFRRWAHFRQQDIAELEVQPMGGDLVAVRPHANLEPGEYALASHFEPGDRWIRLGYDFGLVAVRGQ